jgi:hypothetical protein
MVAMLIVRAFARRAALLGLSVDEDGNIESMWCCGCHAWMTPRVIDESIDHAFGSHEQYRVVCPECEGSALLNEEPIKEEA